MYRELFGVLSQQHGPQGWWPADEPFEIMAGAVLVQRTAWRNAALAIDALKQAQALSPAALAEMDPVRLAALVKPAGFFRVKAQRLQALAQFVVGSGGLVALRRWSTETLRAALLDVRGIGPETADAILGYAFERPVFVIDAYTRRLMGRICHPQALAADPAIKAECERELKSVAELNELHALIVAHGQRHCRPVAACVGCRLQPGCGYGRDTSRTPRQPSCGWQAT